VALWDVHRDVRDNRIIAIRPAAWFAKRLAESLKNSLTKDKDGKPWSCLQADYEFPFAVTTEELGTTYFDKDAVSLEKGGDGLTKTAKELAMASEIKDDSAAAVTAAKALTVEQLDTEIQARGYKPISRVAAVIEEL
jgi:hypothetical protein